MAWPYRSHMRRAVAALLLLALVLAPSRLEPHGARAAAAPPGISRPNWRAPTM